MTDQPHRPSSSVGTERPLPEPGTRPGATTQVARRTAQRPSDEGASWEDRFEHERVGIHNEAETVRRDRIRWGPVWAGIVTAVGTFLFLQLALIALGIVELGEASREDAIATGIAALVAFFLGGLTTGASAMWQGADDGLLHGIVMWFTALVAIIVFSAVGSGLALGSIDTTNVFDQVTIDDIDATQANDTAREAAGHSLLALTLGLLAAAAGSALGSKLWPKDDAFVDVIRRKDTT